MVAPCVCRSLADMGFAAHICTEVLHIKSCKENAEMIQSLIRTTYLWQSLVFFHFLDQPQQSHVTNEETLQSQILGGLPFTLEASLFTLTMKDYIPRLS